MENQAIRVRFAPSPTGYLHVGGARTALYNWLYARKTGGKFILRIEDTDKDRSTQESVDAILESLEWMGIDWDEGPFYQSDNLDKYKEYANKLVEKGLAEKVDDTTEAIILKVPDEGSTILYDIVHGKIEFENKDIKDQVLIKSDGYPAYNFACVIDDALMNITHVARGDDHISNTPKQIFIYNALELKIPKYAHIPLIMGEDNSRLSKRHGATSVSEYKNKGYLTGAFINYLALLGWSPGNNKEILSKQELIDSFSLKRITGKSAIFDNNKLEWMNGQYIKKAETKDLFDIIFNILKQQGLVTDSVDKDWLTELIVLFKNRIRTCAQLADEAKYFFKDDIEYDTETRDKYFKDKNIYGIIEQYKDILLNTDDFSIENLEKVSRDFAEKNQIKSGDIIHPVRIAITGKTVSPGIFEVISLLGKDTTIKRLTDCLNTYK
jgi:glutamyl-tRNA synthetase